MDVAASSELVSVVIPACNAGRYIGAALESVLAQTHARLEAIVVDDASSDDTVAEVQALAARDERIRLLRLDSNHGGPAHPRNVGVRSAHGEWIAFLDADDLWHPRKLEFQMRTLARTRARMCSTAMRDFTSPGGPAWGEPVLVPVRRIDLRMQLRKYRTPTSSIVVARDWIIAHPFNEDRAFRAREDTDCFIRLHEYVDHSVKLDFPFVGYRLQAAGISANKLQMVARHLHMLKQYRLRSGKPLGARAYYYTFTHFMMSLYVRLVRGVL
jgi:teichuronic acid biosynthesis glycosyltransferase TuaG